MVKEKWLQQTCQEKEDIQRHHDTFNLNKKIEKNQLDYKNS